ncbi:glucose 1-dehydrogenase [Nocardia farcinica]|uniref:3-oxoacyl-[acyl-carrier-protein] reductase FabG n=1 Tax=Nocardia farcinica TaxID=37329 RepID=A0A0H5NGN6_NOCFR|nr:glucose 1-dehydrogenase [Nocardia farcinica]AXK89170.1 SDR family oxidoreductase [Nocardia farcinica]MBA4858527.1 glucose 1-dehydrogenase [Nocardia farcinica]MBC9819124.1 glucose 1-dehydrogenase [Nocardia farcinica]MBF6234884.1 glucose 1-dehydrogenase [Nocardia farcinica]MBF6260179.1 glucose 1-dehydrogenase [Nocardia farcinica]
MTVALVTGGSRGIGRAIATRLAADGAAVVVNYRRNAAAASQVVTQIERAGGRALAVAADVADPPHLRGLFEATERTFGGLDVLVVNAGVAHFAPIAETTDADFDELFAVNTRATFHALREAANRLRDGGRIVVISSGAVATARPGSGAYAASKAAVDQLVRTAASELGPRGITVNSVLPGAIRTDALVTTRDPAALDQVAAQTPLRRIGEPDDIAAIVAFLTSPDARWITGQRIHAGGGLF